MRYRTAHNCSTVGLNGITKEQCEFKGCCFFPSPKVVLYGVMHARGLIESYPLPAHVHLQIECTMVLFQGNELITATFTAQVSYIRAKADMYSPSRDHVMLSV